MGHVFVRLPDDLYQLLQCAALETRISLSDLIVQQLEAAWHADAGNASRARASGDPGLSIETDSALALAFDAAASPGTYRHVAAGIRDRFLMEWEVDLPPVQAGEDSTSTSR